jgi:F-type H+-transporting ATPase subunit a
VSFFAQIAEGGAAHEEHVGPAAKTVFLLFGIPVSDTVLSAWLVMAVLVLLAWAIGRNLKLMPSGLQNLVELMVEFWIRTIEQVAGRRGVRFLPLVLTAFLFILASNWIGTLPIFGNISWFRSPNSDLNLTVSMALIVFFTVQFWAIKSAGFLGYLKEFIVPNPLHILTELSRPLSLSVRLFGNIFAGEVLLSTMLGIAPFVLFVFLGIELFVGIIQAIIFAMLTLAYLAIATSHEGAEGHH